MTEAESKARPDLIKTQGQRRSEWPLEQVRAEIDRAVIERRRTDQIMRWQPYIVGGAYFTALVAIFALLVRIAFFMPPPG